MNMWQLVAGEGANTSIMAGDSGWLLLETLTTEGTPSPSKCSTTIAGRDKFSQTVASFNLIELEFSKTGLASFLGPSMGNGTAHPMACELSGAATMH